MMMICGNEKLFARFHPVGINCSKNMLQVWQQSEKQKDREINSQSLRLVRRLKTTTNGPLRLAPQPRILITGWLARHDRVHAFFCSLPVRSIAERYFVVLSWSLSRYSMQYYTNWCSYWLVTWAYNPPHPPLGDHREH